MKLHLNVFYSDHHPHWAQNHLCDKSGGSSALVPPGWGKSTNGLVVARETVDTGLDENEAAIERQFKLFFGMQVANIQLGVPVLAVDRQVLANGNSLLDEHVQIFWDLGCEAW